MPVLIDGLDDKVGHAYSGMPDRLYVIDRAGKVAFKSGRGPFGFNPAEMEQALIMTLLDEAHPAVKPEARGPLPNGATVVVTGVNLRPAGRRRLPGERLSPPGR